MLENICPTVASEIQAVMAGRRFAVAGADRGQSARICEVLSSVRSLTVQASVPASDFEPYDGVIMNLATAADPELVPPSVELNIPILVIGPGDALTAGQGAAYAWADELMSEPWSDGELLMRAYRLLTSPSRRRRSADRSSPLVLIADDDVWLRSLLQSVLKTHGACCYTANDGLQALQLARELVPNLVLLDVDMPLMNGFEVLQSIRSQPGLEAVLIALLTGCNRTEDVARGSELGADDYIAKPVHPLVLTNRIKRLLRSSRQQSSRQVSLGMAPAV